MGSVPEQPLAVSLHEGKLILSAEKTTSANGLWFHFRCLFTPCVSLSK